MKLLPDLPQQTIKRSAYITDILFISTFLFAALANTKWNYWFGLLAGVLLGCVTIASHNYFHQKNNFRMYYFNISLMQTREWRISHILSHHLYTNTIWDMEVMISEPFLSFLPKEKSFSVKYSYFILFPFYWLAGFHGMFLKRLIDVLRGNLYLLAWYDFIPYTLPMAMYLTGNQPILATLWMWTFILTVGSFYFAAIGVNGTHHHPDIFHDGDTPRSVNDYDWGLSQLDTVMDRREITGSHTLVLTTFGDHALHHLFPTLDHGTLGFLYPTFKNVCKQFDVDLRIVSMLELCKGTFLQILRTKPNQHPPDLLKKY